LNFDSILAIVAWIDSSVCIRSLSTGHSGCSRYGSFEYRVCGIEGSASLESGACSSRGGNGAGAPVGRLVGGIAVPSVVRQLADGGRGLRNIGVPGVGRICLGGRDDVGRGGVGAVPFVACPPAGEVGGSYMRGEGVGRGGGGTYICDGGGRGGGAGGPYRGGGGGGGGEAGGP